MRIASPDIKSTVLRTRIDSQNKHWRAIETDGTQNIMVMCKTGHQERTKSAKLADIENLHGAPKFCIRAFQTLIAK